MFHSILRFTFIIFTIPLWISCSAFPKRKSEERLSKAYSDTVKASYENENMWWVYSDSTTVTMSSNTKQFFHEWLIDTAGYEFRRSYLQFFSGDPDGRQFLIGLRMPDILQLMGKPDSEYPGEGYVTTVEYNMEWGCGNPAYDCCWLSINFDKNDKVNMVSVACT